MLTGRFMLKCMFWSPVRVMRRRPSDSNVGGGWTRIGVRVLGMGGWRACGVWSSCCSAWSGCVRRLISVLWCLPVMWWVMVLPLMEEGECDVDWCGVLPGC
jgi:hypothetical protein